MCTFGRIFGKSWILMVLSCSGVLPPPPQCQKRCASCFCFARKKMFFFEKMNFRHFALLYSYAEGELQSENRGFHENHWFPLIFIEKHGFWWFWVVPRCSHTRHNVRNDARHVFVSQEKICFLMKKMIFGTLHHSTAMLKVSFGAKITDFMKIIDFHWFLSKIMDFDDFEWSELKHFRDGAQLKHSCRVVKNEFFAFSQKKNVFFSCETKTCHTSFLTLWRVWEHLGTTQNHQNPWFSIKINENQAFSWNPRF